MICLVWFFFSWIFVTFCAWFECFYCNSCSLYKVFVHVLSDFNSYFFLNFVHGLCVSFVVVQVFVHGFLFFI